MVFLKLFVYAIERIVFSTVPLLISAIMGNVLCVLAFILIIVIVCKTLILESDLWMAVYGMLCYS